mmetsp:Transcript_10637/g.19183  ORF Transcript_10637/g.19183 Transcript_10637/m.19183 type:complete len:343 (-) Transcript_10637:1735-2763(-)|eukprot:CAMPEP_0182443586 /NCGR_PEP_ID=MMETSP1172-20130603/2285_1 /TAXON_ID=708627 /ORGANISM="Timspurckia oligopyrenoides, Strain CCMP3278" /LENGTH=342 /DNA_ID=CAMNT_0024638917 /DNA_START=62 /DNA_END=1090 /DNA_ORIENTATION=-
MAETSNGNDSVKKAMNISTADGMDERMAKGMAQLEMMEKDADFSLPEGGGWALHWWLFSHNSLRLELQDMFFAVQALEKLDKSVADDHLRLFFGWFHHFEILFGKHLEFEELYVMPMIKSKVHPRPSSFPSEDEHVQLGLKLTKIRVLEPLIGQKKPFKVAAELARVCTNFILLALENMRNEESHEVALLEVHGNQAEDLNRLDESLREFYGKDVAELKALASVWQKDMSKEEVHEVASGGNKLMKLGEKFYSKTVVKSHDKRRADLKTLLDAAGVSETPQPEKVPTRPTGNIVNSKKEASMRRSPIETLKETHKEPRQAQRTRGVPRPGATEKNKESDKAH